MADFFDLNFWKSFIASLTATGIFAIILKYFLDSRLERQKNELAKELFEAQIKARIEIESPIEGVAVLHRATLVCEDAIDEFKRGLEKQKRHIIGCRNAKASFAAILRGELMSEIKEETEAIRQNKEKLEQTVSPKIAEFVNAVSLAKARMNKGQRENLDPFLGRLAIELGKDDKGDSLEVIFELKKFLEAESRRLRKLEKGEI